MELTLREFENLNLYSHKNMGKVIRKLVNESYNGVLTSMFDDSLILLDHTNGKFYAVDYVFNERDLTLSLDNFDEIQLVKEEEGFEEAVENFFEDDSSSPYDLVKSYKKNIIEQERYIDDLIAGVISTKDFSESVDYSKIKDARKDVVIESSTEPFFKIYEDRIQTHPLTSIKYFDWKTPVKVSLIETERRSIINTSIIEKAKNMWKRADFKESFIEASELLMEGDDEKMFVLFEEYPVLFHLTEEDRLAVFGKALLSSDLRENRKGIVDEIESLLREDEDFIDLSESYLAEAEADLDIDTEEGDEAKVGKAEQKLELTAEEIDKLKKDLESLRNKMSDSKEKEKLSDIIAKLDSNKEEGTRPAEIKEAVSLLTL